MSERTCEERIGEEYEGRMKDITALMGAIRVDSLEDITDDMLEVVGVTREEFTDSEDFRERAIECLHEYPLAVSVRKVIRVELSWGGPQDYFEADLESGEASDVSYHFLDWFDGARMKAGTTAEDFVNYFAEVADIDA
jgi:hypothetical protein